jgi:hypothetical protein
MTLVWAPGFNGVTDPDAQTYLAAVEAADGQALEGDVALAINDFVVGCKLDGIWDAIKASCILAGARTLTGALVPLKGAAPTNNNFVSGDYNRETGLVGDGSTKYLDSNRNNNADPQDSNHNAVYVSEVPTNAVQTHVYMGVGLVTNEVGVNNIIYTLSGTQRHAFRNRNSTSTDVPSGSPSSGLIGTNRALGGFIYRLFGANTSVSRVSQTPRNANVIVFATEGGNFKTNARFSFYSIGESLDLALLDTRVTTLMTDIGAAIP